MNIDISNYAELLLAAKQQTQPQTLLFVFTNAELPDEPTEQEQENFDQGRGGVLNPVICVDKKLDELSDFAALADESKQMGAEWSIVFAAGLDGSGGRHAGPDEVDKQLDNMVAAIQNGLVSRYLAFDKKGELVRFVHELS